MGLLKFDQHKFAFEANCALERKEAWSAGLQFRNDTLQWETRSPQKAVLLRRYADPCCEKKFKKYFITDTLAPEQILYPDHLHPHWFQIESAWHCLTRSPAYCADDMGLGKTVTSILCMNTIIGKTLIICPPFLKYNWADEIAKWSTRDWCSVVAVIEDGTTPLASTFQAGIIILPDSMLTNAGVQEHLKKEKFTWLFVDEAHRYKSGDAQRTTALLGDEDGKESNINTERCVYLSGTPIPNGKPIELYPLLARAAPESIQWRQFQAFGEEFCNGRMVTHYEQGRPVANWDFSGSSNLKTFRIELRRKFMVRHLKKDVLDDLPPKSRSLVFLDNTTKMEKFERQLLKNYTMEELLGEGSDLGDMARYQKEVGIAKIPQALEYIKNLLDNCSDKLVVFAHHIDVVETLAGRLADYGCLKIRGGMTSKMKSEQVKAFQTKTRHRVVCGNILSMGVGNTMTAAPMCVVVEPAWVPGDNTQAEDRIHRIGQNQFTYFRYLVMRGSLDERKLRSVMAKESNIQKVMG